MTKREFLEFWGYTEGTPEGEELWEQKVAMNEGRHLRRAPMVFVGRDIHYQSPIDGRVIDSKAKREDDLARHGCIEYDPGMKQDYQRRIGEGEKALDASVDAHVDRVLTEMGPRKLEKLVSELKSGADARIVRQGA